MDGLLVVDYAAGGRALRVEITFLDAVTFDRLNVLRPALGQAPLVERRGERRPRRARSSANFDRPL